MPELTKRKELLPELFSKSKIYEQLLDLNRKVGRISKTPIKGLRGSIKISKEEWIDQVVEMESWLED